MSAAVLKWLLLILTFGLYNRDRARDWELAKREVRRLKGKA